MIKIEDSNLKEQYSPIKSLNLQKLLCFQHLSESRFLLGALHR